ncbi:hypothetical protein [Streptomyces sp. HNM0574]|nr:hypothetical protein [Streptomyces sp. HNM0574]NLU67562.1 hypothetical protein [Streptomyces sp. HNM0574]
MSSVTSAAEQPSPEEQRSGPLPDAPVPRLPGAEGEEDPAERHICRGID